MAGNLWACVFLWKRAFAHAGSAVEKALLHKINKKPLHLTASFVFLATNCTHSTAALNFASGAGKSFVRASYICYYNENNVVIHA